MQTIHRLEHSDALPSLPYVAHEILLALNAPEPDAVRVVGAINRDPALTARLISMANSASFRSMMPVYSVQDAILRLGINRVRMLAVSIVLARQLDTRRCPSFDAPGYWLEAMSTAVTAGQLGRYVPLDTGPESAHLAGLVHSIGVLLLVSAFPDDMDILLREAAADPGQEPWLLERRRLGFDRYAAGAMLLEEWELPEVISRTVAAFPDPRREDQHWTLLRLLRGSLAWVRGDFDELPPELEDPANLPAGLIEATRRTCLREHEWIRGMATLLGSL